MANWARLLCHCSGIAAGVLGNYGAFSFGVLREQPAILDHAGVRAVYLGLGMGTCGLGAGAGDGDLYYHNAQCTPRQDASNTTTSNATATNRRPSGVDRAGQSHLRYDCVHPQEWECRVTGDGKTVQFVRDGLFIPHGGLPTGTSGSPNSPVMSAARWVEGNCVGSVSL